MTQQPQQPQIDLSQAVDLKCNACDSVYFKESLMLKKVSRFLTGADRDQLVPISVLRCDDCGSINDELKPIS